MKNLLTKLLSIAERILCVFAGSFRWEPPLWIRFLARAITWPFKLKPLNIAVLITLAAGLYGYVWWKNLPEPHKITFAVIRPQATRLEKDAKVNPLVIKFSGSAASLDKIGKDITKGITIAPFVSGTWRWQTDAELTFMPANDWEVGKQYAVVFEKNLFAPQVLLKEYRLSFDSPYFAPQVKSGEFYEDPTNPKNKQVVVGISFSHPVDKSSFERHVSLKMRVDPVKNFEGPEAMPLGFRVVYTEDGSEAYIRSDVVTIPERDGEVLVTLEPGVLAARGGKPSDEKLTRTVQVPGVENYFKIAAVQASTITNKDTYKAERILTIESTAAVTQKELASHTEFFLLPDDPALYDNLGDADIAAEPTEEGDESYSEEIDCPLASAGQVTTAILNKAQKLPVEWIPTEQEFSQLQSARFSAPAGRCIFVRIQKGTKSFGDYPLFSDRSFLADTKPFDPDIKIIGEGAILSASGGKKLSIMTRNVDSVKYRLFRILPNALHHLTTQTNEYGGTFASPEFNYNFGPEQISEVFSSEGAVPPGDPGAARYVSFDFASYIASGAAVPKGLFILEASGWDPARKMQVGPINKRLVLLTDLGFVVKENQVGTRDLFVTSLQKGGGIAGAKVEVLGKNGLPVFSGLTNDIGRVLIPSLKDMKFEKQPTVYVVERDGDLSFMPFERRDRQLNFSRFDVGGLYTQKEQESLQGYLFSDRGIYRPGETAHIGIILKSAEWSKLPDGIPFELSVIEPRGIEIKRSSLRFGPDGFAEYTFPVSEDALTGSYQFELSLARPKRSKVLLGTATIRVDEFLPDRLKIDAVYAGLQEQQWYAPDGLKIEVTLRNLYGTAAEGHTVRGSVRLTPFLPYFPAYREYSFFDPFKGKNSFNESIGDVTTDADGKANFDLNLNRFEKAIYQLFFIAEGFEKDSGRSVVTNLSSIINPLPYLIGYKTDGDASFIKRGSTISFELIALDKNLKKTDVDGLNLALIEKRYVSILTKDDSGSLRYQSVEKKNTLSETPVSVNAKGTVVSFPSETPGNFVYVLKDKSGLVLSEISFSVVGDANVSRSLEKNAELKLKLDRQDYAPGDEIQIEVQAPYTGAGLITIERDKVYAAKWFSTTTTSSIQTITVPEGLEGNGYINVSFVRGVDSPDVYMSPLSYGVEPFAIGKARRTEATTVTVPERVQPGDSLKIQVQTKDPARTVVFAIDEGILQVARYKRPDPLAHFFRKRALEVDTMQILDLLLPEFSILQNIAAAGGDEDALLGRRKNPFKRKGQKPVVYWSGIIPTDAKSKSVEFPIPDYFNGSVKVFAVSVTRGAIGVAERAVTVQGDIVLTPNVPLVASPGDTFEVSAVVANIRGDAPRTEVSVEADGLSIVGDTLRSLELAKGKDSVATFTVKAEEVLGSADIRFKAVNGSKTASYTLSLSIRPASPLLTSVRYGVVKAGAAGSKEISLERKLYPDLSQRSVSASAVPLGLAQGLKRYLERYPFGCSEQLASQAYPNLVFLFRADLGVSGADARKSLEKALSILSARQNDDGSFKLWPGVNAPDALSIHIARLLIESRGMGIDVPEALYGNALSYLRNLANKPTTDLQSARNHAYAVYILTRAGEVTTSYLDALKGALDQYKDTSWKKDITALFMAATYMQLSMEPEALALVKGVSATSENGVKSYHEDALSHTAHYLYLLSRHFPDKAKALSPELLEKVSDELLSMRYNTLSAALLMLGLNEYQNLVGTPEGAGVVIDTSVDGQQFSPLSIAPGLFPTTGLPSEISKLRIQASLATPIFYTVEETGFDKGAPAAIQQGIEILREYRNKKGEIISEANLGDDIEVRIVVRALEDPSLIGQVAVSDLFPAGFELQGGSLALQSPPSRYGILNWYPEFTDAREDRALLFGMLGTDAQEYTYSVKAVSRGTFVVPPVQVDAMYNQRFAARNASSVFTVR